MTRKELKQLQRNQQELTQAVHACLESMTTSLPEWSQTVAQLQKIYDSQARALDLYLRIAREQTRSNQALRQTIRALEKLLERTRKACVQPSIN